MKKIYNTSHDDEMQLKVHIVRTENTGEIPGDAQALGQLSASIKLQNW